MISIKEYEPLVKSEWDQLVKDSKNGVFFFYRDYLEYHSDRFTDSSLMFFKGDKLIAILPANIKDNTLISHEGLTFGGILISQNIRTSLMLEIFESLIDYLKKKDIKKVIYKAIPHIYHTIPADEDLYALFRNNAKLIRRDVASAIALDGKFNFSRLTRRNLKLCKEAGLKIKPSGNFEDFMIEKGRQLMAKYGVNPTHTPEEMELLVSKFPDNIKLFTAEKDGNCYAGAVVYESKNVAHCQYQTATSEGLKLHASDLIFEFLIDHYQKCKGYFDFGISTENNGIFLNKGLARFKERFGARAIVYDFYKMEV